MTRFESLQVKLRHVPKKWLVTGAAGFIGSHLVEALLKLDQTVVGLDNFETGSRRNLDEVRASVSPQQWNMLRFQEGDIRSLQHCEAACSGVDYVLHQAALGSVPRSLNDPLHSHRANVDGFLNMLVAARNVAVKKFVFASSSSVYGDDINLPKREASVGAALSPYALTKQIDEAYAKIFARCYGVSATGLRYFNVFGPRQNPEGEYAAVIPKWVRAALTGEAITINGDGSASRDFCYVANVVQANILSAEANSGPDPAFLNIACGERTTLIALWEKIKIGAQRASPGLGFKPPVHSAPRRGDVPHSLADIESARSAIGYMPGHNLESGLELTIKWMCR